MGRLDSESETLIPTIGGGFDVATTLRSHHGNPQLDQTMVAHSLKGEGFDASEDGTGRGTPLVALPLGTRIDRGGSHREAEGNNLICFDARQQDVIQYGNKSGPIDTDSHSIAVAFAQNQRDEVRLMDVAGALARETGAKQQTYAHVGMQVRRLTPLECERLQGFPDGWTDVPYNGKPAKDGPRYKALGNSMAVNCMAWLGQRISQVEMIA